MTHVGLKVEEIIIFKVKISFCLKSCESLNTSLCPVALEVENTIRMGPLVMKTQQLPND